MHLRQHIFLKKVEGWIAEVRNLTKIAMTQPHAAYSCFAKGWQSKYTYCIRTVPGISQLVKPLNKEVNNCIKVLFNGYEFGDLERELWLLPVKYEGLGILIPSQICDQQYN